MSDDLILWLPDAVDGPISWQRLSDGQIAAGGPDIATTLPEFTPERIVAFAPVTPLGLGWLALPNLPNAQRDAAAREYAKDWIADQGLSVHLATGTHTNAAGENPVVWVGTEIMQGWIDRLAEFEFRADRLIPSSLLLPFGPEACRGRFGEVDLLGKDGLVWRDDEALNAAFGATADWHILTDRECDAAIMRAIDDPPLNLLVGRFAPQKPVIFNSRWWRRVAIFAALLALVSISIPWVEAFKLNSAASRIERETSAALYLQFPGASDPQTALQAAISARGGAGPGFVPLANAVAKAISETVGTELTMMRYTGDQLEIGVRAGRPDEADQFKQRLQAAGLSVETGASTSNQGTAVSIYQVRSR